MNSESRTVYLFLPGINHLKTPFQAMRGVRRFPSKAKTWVNINTPHKGDEFIYLAMPITRAFFSRDRARRFASVLTRYLERDFKITVVAHSNGANVLSKALSHVPLRLLAANPISKVVFISSALQGHLTDSTIYSTFRNGGIRFMENWVAGQDKAMAWAKIFGKIVGYGSELGRMTRDEFIVHTGTRGFYKIDSEKGHSSWFDSESFEATMLDLTR